MMKDIKPKILEFDDALILPQKKAADGPLWGLGGVIDSNNEFVKESFYDGGWATHGGYYSWNDEEYLDINVIYIGLYASHWGHFLIDMTTRLWGIPVLKDNISDFKIAYLGEETFSANNLEFMKLLGIDEEQLFHITKPVRFKKVYLPQQAFKSCEWYTEEHLKMIDRVIAASASSIQELPDSYQCEKVYFSRRRFGKALQSEFGEEYFERLFSDNGFTVLFPETMSLREQIYIWNHASEIICINGTIPLNVLFSQNSKLRLTILNKTSIVHENPYLLLEMRGIEAAFIDVFKEPLKKFPKSLGEGPFLLWPTNDFDKYCIENNIIDSLPNKKRQYYFSKSEALYYLSILNIKGKIRLAVSKIVPAKAKLFLKKVLPS